MGYQLIYNSSFKDIDENTINIEIYRDSGGTLIASELLCSADAVSINYESDDDVFKPIKCSDCQINVLTTKVLANLYTALGNILYHLEEWFFVVVWVFCSLSLQYRL